MRPLILVALCLPFLPGCQNMNAAIQESRQERCQAAEWPKVGERDGVDGLRTAADRYAYICGDLFQPGPYNEGLQKGLARRPTPPV
jgi:hypothetical protein